MDELDQEIDLDQITDENLLQSLLDQTDDPEDRKVIRDRIKELKATKKAERDEKMAKLTNTREDMLQAKKREAEEHKRKQAEMYQKMAQSAPAGAPKQMDTSILRSETSTAKTATTTTTSSKTISSNTGNLPLTIGPKVDAVEDAIQRRKREAEERKRAILAAYDIAAKSAPAGTVRDVDLNQKIDVNAYEQQKVQGAATFQMSGGVRVVKKITSVPTTPTNNAKPSFPPELDAMELALRERQREAAARKQALLDSYKKVAAQPAGPKVWAQNV